MNTKKVSEPDQKTVDKLIKDLGAANPAQPQQSGPTLEDLNNAKTISCEKCQCVTWAHGFLLKRTSALSLVGEQNVAVPVIYCNQCGTPNKNSVPCVI